MANKTQNVNGDGNMVAGGNITKSKNKNKIFKQIRKETIIISFIVGFLASLFASYIFNFCFT